MTRPVAKVGLGSVVSGGETVGFAYGYTPANQRQAVTNADGSYWVYAYDALGQVTAGVKHWPDGSLVPAQQFSYSFDDIGNRQTTKTGGDANGHKLRTATYTANDLNQYTRRTVPGYVDVAGSASTDATVTVNHVPTHRRGDYFWAELAVTNETGPLHVALTNVAVINQGTNADLIATNLGHVLIPPTPETFTNDADGNLIADGLWTYEWDAENRLIHMLSRAELPETARTDLRFTYDHQGRRISKTVSNWISGNWSLITDHRFLYDGWNLLAVLAADLSPQTSFTWGLDASGTEQGAGGVGGLLSMTFDTGTNAGTYFPCYDGNWNVVALANAATGGAAAQYEYGPFHELIRATGPVGRDDPCLAATKYYDRETGLYYYGSRYYSPSTGRWSRRDPIEEPGSKNLYGFVRNAPLARINRNGLDEWPIPPIEIPPDVPDWPPWHPPPPPRPPSIIVSSTWYGSCRGCPVAYSAAARVNIAVGKGTCRAWLSAHGALDGYEYVLLCRSSCNPMSWFSKTWTSPGQPGISLARNECNTIGEVELASLLIHEIAHHSCPPIGFGGETCAESAQDACNDAIVNP